MVSRPGRTFTVVFTPTANREFRKLARRDQERIRPRVDALQRDPHPRGVEKLAGAELYRIRVGDYRVIYQVDEAASQVIVARIGHRREVYR